MTVTIAGYVTGPYTLGAAHGNTYTILVSGTVRSASDGIVGNSASVWALANSGLIAAADTGVALAAGMLVNAGTITAATGFLGQGSAVYDTGLIAGSSFGIDLLGGSTTVLGGGEVTGAEGLAGYGSAIVLGTINGTGGTAIALATGHASYLLLRPGAVLGGTVVGGGESTLVFGAGVSPGTFSGLGGHYNDFATIDIAAGAAWTAAGFNTLGSDTLSLAAQLVVTGTLANGASIVLPNYGIAAYGGSVVNSGQIHGNACIFVYGGGAVSNSGTIAGGAYGVYAKTSLVTNLAGGLITASTDGVHLGTATLLNGGTVKGSLGVYLSGGVVTNAPGGQISASVEGVAGAGTVINDGTISGANAISLAAGRSELLVVEPGASFAGRVDGGNLPGSATISTLAFAAGAPGTFSGLGSTYVDFGSVTIDSGASWTAGGAESLAAGATLADSGALQLASQVSGNGTIALLGSGLTLTAAAGAAPLATLAGLPGNTLELDGFVATGHTLAGHALTLASAGGNVTLALAGSYLDSQLAISTSGGNSFVTACFASGTRIETRHGATPVEALAIGERVRTFSGRLARIIWIGHRRVDLARHPAPRQAMPVRVSAGALAPGVPRCDLLLSPDHALFLNGVLVLLCHKIWL